MLWIDWSYPDWVWLTFVESIFTWMAHQQKISTQKYCFYKICFYKKIYFNFINRIYVGTYTHSTTTDLRVRVFISIFYTHKNRILMLHVKILKVIFIVNVLPILCISNDNHNFMIISNIFDDFRKKIRM